MTQAIVERETSGMIRALTGARFIAAFAVILVHATRLGLRGQNCGFEQMANNAVSFFFVLSGFILTYVYFDKLTWRSIPSYYCARWARIWPLHVVCLLAAIAVLAWQSRIVYSRETFWQFWASLGLLQSWLPFAHWWKMFNGPSWSISTELGFYLIFPFFLWLGKNRFWPMVLGVSLVTAVIIGYLNHWGFRDSKFSEIGYAIASVNPLCRMLEFVVGMWVGRLFLRNQQDQRRVGIGFDTYFEIAALALVVYSYVSISRSSWINQWLLSQNYRLVADWLVKGPFMIPAFALLIWVLAWSKGWVARGLSRPLMVWLGEISFAFYMIQYIVIASIYPYTQQMELSVGVVVFVVIGGSLGLSALLYAIVEVPCRSALRRFVSGEFSQGWRAFAGIPKALKKSGVGILAVCLITASWTLLTYEVNRQSFHLKEIAEKLETKLADSGFQRVTFTDEAVLVAYEYRIDDGRLKIDFYWKSLPSSRRQRFVHISDAQGKFIRQLVPISLLKIGSESFLLDRVEIKTGDLPADCTLGVGFYSQELRTTPADRGTRRMNGRRLELFKWDGKEVVSLAVK